MISQSAEMKENVFICLLVQVLLISSLNEILNLNFAVIPLILN